MANDDDNLEDAPAYSSLGDRLKTGLINCWKVVRRLDSTVDKHARTIAWLTEQMERHERELAKLRSEMHGLKVGKGKYKAKALRLEAKAAAVEAKLEDVRKKRQRLQ